MTGRTQLALALALTVSTTACFGPARHTPGGFDPVDLADPGEDEAQLLEDELLDDEEAQADDTDLPELDGEPVSVACHAWIASLNGCMEALGVDPATDTQSCDDAHFVSDDFSDFYYCMADAFDAETCAATGQLPDTIHCELGSDDPHDINETEEACLAYVDAVNDCYAHDAWPLEADETACNGAPVVDVVTEWYLCLADAIEDSSCSADGIAPDVTHCEAITGG